MTAPKSVRKRIHLGISQPYCKRRGREAKRGAEQALIQAHTQKLRHVGKKVVFWSKGDTEQAHKHRSCVKSGVWIQGNCL